LFKKFEDEHLRPDISPTKLAEILRKTPIDELNKMNQLEFEQTDRDYKKFVKDFKSGFCLYCKKSLKSFSIENPCLHWLLRPKNFKKKHFMQLTQNFSYFRISAYVRWIATIDNPIKNINDLLIEHEGDNLIDFTAKYKHIKWSFSCSKSDFQGHKNSTSGNLPHYHMQIFLDNRPFISYKDFHIPLHSDDLYDFDLFINHSDIAKHIYSKGTGLQEVFDNEKALEKIIDISTTSENLEEATFKFDTLIFAKEGETLSSKLVVDAIEESKRTGQTITSILKKNLDMTKVDLTTIVSPSDSVVLPHSRKGGRKKG
jgi:hypothetical protein